MINNKLIQRLCEKTLEKDLQEAVRMVPFGQYQVKVLEDPSSMALANFANQHGAIRVMRIDNHWFYWNASELNHSYAAEELGLSRGASDYLGFELHAGTDYDTKKLIFRPYSDCLTPSQLQAMVVQARHDPKFMSSTRHRPLSDVTGFEPKSPEPEHPKPVSVKPFMRDGHWVHGYRRSEPNTLHEEDAIPVNCTGTAIDSFSPLLMTSKVKKFKVKRRKKIQEDADFEIKHPRHSRSRDGGRPPLLALGGRSRQETPRSKEVEKGENCKVQKE